MTSILRLSLIPALLLAACSRSPEPIAAAPAAATAPPATVLIDEPSQPLPTTMLYHCEGDVQITVINLDTEGEKIKLSLPGEAAAELPHVASASGAKYDNGTLVFWGTGDQALIERGGKTLYQACRLTLAAS